MSAAVIEKLYKKKFAVLVLPAHTIYSEQLLALPLLALLNIVCQ